MNHLANETSLYLRQHAGNPVDWYPWGPIALERAKTETKPIFLSIGYSACHWCHVMEHESFVDPEIAAYLNNHFINIKVDREERPDIDNIYMSAVQALTGHGGWPMSVFLTPDLQPFYAGTYFPPEQRHGMPSFRQVLEAVANAWQNKQAMVMEQANNITAALEQHAAAGKGEGVLDESLLRNAGKQLSRAYDLRHGGFGRAPKFPHPLDLRLLLRLYHRYQDVDALQMVTHTLDQMARGGIYDQLAGGFHRYSTDERWLAPHFEKMLYDNALLVPVYLEAYQATKHTFFLRIAEEVLHWVSNEMTSPAGGFYSTTDADSEGVEGKFFVWSLDEVKQILNADDAEFAEGVFDIAAAGNWEGHTILTRPKSDAQEVALWETDEASFLKRLNHIREQLLAVREMRIKPGRDEKILSAWNGLMIAAYVQAAQVTGMQDYLKRAQAAANFVLTHMRQPDGKLFRTALDGGPAKLNGYLEDYAFFIDGLLHLVQASWEQRWLTAATELAEIMISQFWDESSAGFYFVGHDHEKLILREKQANDNATPSGNSMAITALLKLSRLTGNKRYADYAEKALQHFAGGMEQHPMAYGQMLVALDDALGPIEEFAVFPEGQRSEVLALLHRQFRPRKLIAGPPLTIPLLDNRSSIDGQPTVYHCVNQTCDLPWVGLPELESRL
jgi:uncharacterized protein YyaL (SSP411 family)